MRLRFIMPLLLGVSLAAQSPPPDPRFEVASVKLVPIDQRLSEALGCSGYRTSFRARQTTTLLVACAYDVPVATAEREILGLPKWASEDMFQIDATLPQGTTKWTEITMMLRELLTERFGLQSHREHRSLPSYMLTRGRKDGALGPHLTPTEGDCRTWVLGGRKGAPPSDQNPTPCGRQIVAAGKLEARAVEIAQLVNMLSARVSRPVENRTDLIGPFDMTLAWADDTRGPAVNPNDDALPTSIFTALQEQLGLHLEPGTVDREVLVIDHIERPSEN